MKNKKKQMTSVFKLLKEDITKKEAEKISDPKSLHAFLKNIDDTLGYTLPLASKAAGTVLAKHPEEFKKVEKPLQSAWDFIKSMDDMTSALDHEIPRIQKVWDAENTLLGKAKSGVQGAFDQSKQAVAGAAGAVKGVAGKVGNAVGSGLNKAAGAFKSTEPKKPEYTGGPTSFGGEPKPSSLSTKSPKPGRDLFGSLGDRFAKEPPEDHDWDSKISQAKAKLPKDSSHSPVAKDAPKKEPEGGGISNAGTVDYLKKPDGSQDWWNSAADAVDPQPTGNHWKDAKKLTIAPTLADPKDPKKEVPSRLSKKTTDLFSQEDGSEETNLKSPTANPAVASGKPSPGNPDYKAVTSADQASPDDLAGITPSKPDDAKKMTSAEKEKAAKVGADLAAGKDVSDEKEEEPSDPKKKSKKTKKSERRTAAVLSRSGSPAAHKAARRVVDTHGESYRPRLESVFLKSLKEKDTNDEDDKQQPITARSPFAKTAKVQLPVGDDEKNKFPFAKTEFPPSNNDNDDDDEQFRRNLSKSPLVKPKPRSPEEMKKDADYRKQMDQQNQAFGGPSMSSIFNKANQAAHKVNHGQKLGTKAIGFVGDDWRDGVDDVFPRLGDPTLDKHLNSQERQIVKNQVAGLGDIDDLELARSTRGKTSPVIGGNYSGDKTHSAIGLNKQLPPSNKNDDNRDWLSKRLGRK